MTYFIYKEVFITQVIGKSTYATVYTCQIPTFLKLYPIGFCLLLVPQLFYVDCKCHNDCR